MIYWDNSATTPCAPEVIEVMQRYWTDEFGNPSSNHLMGRNAERAVKNARMQMARLINVTPPEIIFTSGATESNNILFLAVLLSPPTERKRIVISAVEHKSILEPATLLKRHGFDVVKLPVNQSGAVDLNIARNIITPNTLLVSVQAANSEIGTLQPISELAQISHEIGAYFHTDAAQFLGKLPLDMQVAGCDFASFSAHKMYGPKGVGALFIRGGIRQWPWARPFNGGGQENGLRPGTNNVPAIIGFGEACAIGQKYLQDNQQLDVIKLEAELIARISKTFPQAVIHALSTARLPGLFSIAFPNIPADLLIDNLQTLAVSKGSACSNRALTTSHVLDAIGCDSEIAKETIRISLGRQSNQFEVTEALEMLSNSIDEIRNSLR